MSRKMKAILPLAVLGIVTMLPASSQAQTLSNAVGVTLNALVADYIAVSASALNVNFNLVPGTGPTPGDTTVTVTTDYSLAGGPTLELWGSFVDSTAALTDGGGNSIPSGNVLGSVDGGAATAFGVTGPFGGANAGLQIFTLGGATSGSEVQNLDLSIDLTTQGALPPGAYSGTLSLQARAQ